MNILALVGSSADTARTIGAIAEQAGTSRREVEVSIQTARLNGIPLVTSEKGVWRAQTAQEALKAAERLRVRAIHQLLTARALRATGRRMQAAAYQQTTLFEEAA